MPSVPPFPRVADPMRYWARRAPERVALVDRVRDRRLTYRDLDQGADRWAGVLERRGISSGSIVGALATNRVEMVDLFHACGRLGAALLPLNWRLAAAELAQVLGDARPDLIVGEGRFRALAESALAATSAPGWIDLDDEAPRLFRASERRRDDAVVDPDTPALVLYTSGSTGQPKGAILPRRQIFYNALSTTIGWELGAADVAPVSTPFFHTGGWNVFATPLWQRGGRVVLFDAFAPDEYLRGLAEEGCTAALTVPTQLLMLTASAEWGRELPALRFFISGGAPCPASLAERVRASGYRFREGYGLTECGPNCFGISDEEAVRRPGSVGWPNPFLEMRLVDERGHDVPDGEAGELWLRGPQMFGGYLRNAERTREAVTESGWLRTGDLARRDAVGAYTICGRRKEMFISGGENVFPGEVEAALADCPGVAEVVVIGVPDEKWGEVGRAFVVARAEASVNEQVVLAHARARLAGYKVPKSVVFLDEIARLGSGKPDRRALAALSGSMVG